MNWFAGLRVLSLVCRSRTVRRAHHQENRASPAGLLGPCVIARGAAHAPSVRRGQRGKKLQQVRALVFRNDKGIAL